MARLLEQTEERGGEVRASARQAALYILGVGLFIGLVGSGCVNVGTDGAGMTGRVDIVVLATDPATADALVERLQDVEKRPGLLAGQGAWFRGHLLGVRDGSVYTVLVGQIGDQDDMTAEGVIWDATRVWRPRYVLVVGTAPAVPYDDPLGAVGLVTLICGFDLDQFNRTRDAGNCHRADWGLFAAALSVAEEWELAANVSPDRVGCSSARVMKLATLSGVRTLGPGFVETVTKLSEDLHRGLIVEREGILVAKAVERLRYETREPVGLMMIRGVSEIRVPGAWRDLKQGVSEKKQRALQEACAARDTADFAVDLIRERWPVSSYTQNP